MDVNRQAWTGTTTLLVHPADLYVGLRSERYFVERGTPLKVDFIVTDLDGNPVADRPVEVTRRPPGVEIPRTATGSEEEVDVQTCTAGSQTEPVTCTFETPVGGTYRITAVVTDDQGRQNQSQFTRWVSGGKQPPPAQGRAGKGHPDPRQRNLPARRHGPDPGAVALQPGRRPADRQPQRHPLHRSASASRTAPPP